MKEIYWVGPRQSDIIDIEPFLSGSVTIYGNNENGNIAYCNEANRINHNIENSDCDNFFKYVLEEISEKKPHVQFLFYNFAYAYKYGEKVIKHTIGLNKKDLLDTLSDKIRCRFIFNDIVNTLPYVTLKGKECSYANISKYFSGFSDYIIQKTFSSGGQGTYRIDKSTSISCIGTSETEDEYLVSPYIEDSISLNIHINICKKNILLFPPSVQIINELDQHLLYHGADFICYETLPCALKKKVESASLTIGKFLQNRGYRGILGIDFLLEGENLYFMEINPRFQASSQLLNKTLVENYQTSLQEIHLQSFELDEVDIKCNFTVPYSNYSYTNQNITSNRLHKIFASSEILSLQTDGYNIQKNFPDEKNTYLCRCVFGRNICTITHGKILLHPNIFVEDIKTYLVEGKQYNYKEHIKIALLNHGLTFTEEAYTQAQTQGTIKDAVFDAVDLTIFNGVFVNAPIKCKFVSFSPFTIDIDEKKYFLYFDGVKISEVKIAFAPDALQNKTTKNGVPFDAIINLANDRIRINPAPVCIYKQQKIPCKFCNLPEQNSQYNMSDIKEVIDYCLKYVDFKHFLIGGGTYSTQGGWEIITQIAQYIHSKCNRNIYLMSVPPKDIAILDSLKTAGITEVAFNLEIFDRKLAQSVMPGKGTIRFEQYTAAFEHSVELWGKNGNVRSLLIYGFDTETNFLVGIEQLCKYGIEPIISVFRPLENTEYSELNPPSTIDVISMYHKCKSIVTQYSLILGPDCPECQNNTLSYTEPV